MRQFLCKRFPCLLIAKAWLYAWAHALSSGNRSFSQASEDEIVERLLDGRVSSDAIYIDVGGNHPSRLNNTYRFYRQGQSGIVIEPNRALLRIHAAIRRRDRRLAIGCGERAGIFRFRHSVSHVLSGFDSAGLKANEFRVDEWMPVLPLDTVWEGMGSPKVFLMSIDVEGFDLAVARGAVETLKHTRIVVIEGSTADEEMVFFFRDQGFTIAAETLHNVIFLREI